MSPEAFAQRLAEICRESLPVPAGGRTPLRHRRLMEVGREDVSLAKLAEAHWDALAILAEAGREPEPNAIYGVWASAIPGSALILEPESDGLRMAGLKRFCSGAGLLDRALVTVAATDTLLVEIDLRKHLAVRNIDTTSWHTDAFRLTQTATVTFENVLIEESAILGSANWYVTRPGFWHGACGPAACWAGGAAGLLDFATANFRRDSHTLAHLGAMQANVWALQAFVQAAGQQIDLHPSDRSAAQIRALQLRHLVEQTCTDTLRRFARAYGPTPLSMDASVARRYQEVDLFLRQSHAERDLEVLGRLI